jgi:hypothetical protein
VEDDNNNKQGKNQVVEAWRLDDAWAARLAAWDWLAGWRLLLRLPPC